MLRDVRQNETALVKKQELAPTVRISEFGRFEPVPMITAAGYLNMRQAAEIVRRILGVNATVPAVERAVLAHSELQACTKPEYGDLLVDERKFIAVLKEGKELRDAGISSVKAAEMWSKSLYPVTRQALMARLWETQKTALAENTEAERFIRKIFLPGKRGLSRHVYIDKQWFLAHMEQMRIEQNVPPRQQIGKRTGKTRSLLRIERYLTPQTLVRMLRTKGVKIPKTLPRDISSGRMLSFAIEEGRVTVHVKRLGKSHCTMVAGKQYVSHGEAAGILSEVNELQQKAAAAKPQRKASH
jgi:hypothetical protein